MNFLRLLEETMKQEIYMDAGSDSESSDSNEFDTYLPSDSDTSVELPFAELVETAGSQSVCQREWESRKPFSNS